MRLFRRIILLILLILIVVLPLVVVLQTFEKTPAVKETEVIDTDSAIRARALAEETIRELLKHGSTATVSVSASEDDLNSLMAFVARAITRLEGHASVTQQGLEAAITFRLPHNPVGDFINLRFDINPSESGLNISRITIGSLEVSDSVAIFILRFILDMALGNKNGTVALNALQSVVFNHNTATFNIRPIPDILKRKEKIRKRFKILRDDLNLISEPETVRLYYTRLVKLGNSMPDGEPVSLARFIGPVFELAQQRSFDSDPAEENQAAILALAIYAGDWRFERLIGQVRTDKMSSHRRLMQEILLDGREDLRLHFLISAGLKVVADSGITYTIGEYKELMDARRGGSGFSFADLAADRAGTRFAAIATDRMGGARSLQSVLAGKAREDDFFPLIHDLPEELSQYKFERQYGSVEDDKYIHMVNLIDERISRLPAYSLSGFKEK